MAQFRKLLPEKELLAQFPWKIALKLLLTGFFLILLWVLLKKQEQGLRDVLLATLTHLKEGEGIWLCWLLALVPVNWALESLKWQLLVNKIQTISFTDAVCSTLSGLLSGLALPAQIGDVVGRVAALNIAHRSRTIGAAFISGGIQFYAAIFAGLLSLFFLWDRLGAGRASLVMLTLLLGIVVAAGFLMFIFRKPLLAGIPSNGLWRKVRSSLEVINDYSNGELLLAFGIGALRYLTYMAQFVAGLLLFAFELSFIELVSCVALVLMIKTVMPALNLLGDLGLRGVSAVLIFGKFGILPDEIIAVTLLIWVTNILIPALFGLFLIWVRSWKFI